MSHPPEIEDLLRKDPRYQYDAYLFVRDALSFAQDQLEMRPKTAAVTDESHLTGQQLCEAIRRFALEQYGFMAKTVLNSWGVFSTSDFGNVVYNLIEISLMKKSADDRREHFDDVFDFDQAFQRDFEISMPE
ncbi:MAG: hypothetical protein QGG36_28820 [Pirellulaceae bacterium]|jgi:uncharacterized repeat protein (TIGR04138 family)|nr:hypothetical protein [Pirellulaceae bacterium]MDP7019836.1 hypothetical protein [Pirellulaceae bacterium]